MKEQFVETSNYIKLSESISKLLSYPPTSPRMGLGYGAFGRGKTMSLERIAMQHDAILLRAAQTWSKASLMTLLCRELGLDEKGHGNDKYVRVLEELVARPRIIMIDEIDALLSADKKSVLESLRDLHDESGITLFFIGMEEANAKMKRHKHYYSRVIELVKFEPVTAEDIAKFSSLCDVRIEDDLLDYFQKKFRDLRSMKVVLTRLEKACKTNAIGSIGLQNYNKIKKESGVEDGID